MEAGAHPTDGLDIEMDLAPKGGARVARAHSSYNPTPVATGSAPEPSRRKLLAAGAALAAGATPAAATPADAPHPDAELIRLADLAVATCRLHRASLSDAVDIPPEAEAETERLSALQDEYCVRAAQLPARTAAGRCAKAKTVALANSHNLACEGDPAFYTLESFLDDAMGGEGAVRAFYADVLGLGRDGVA